MKKFILSALVAVLGIIAPTTASAQEPAVYTSEEHGIAIPVPENSKVDEDKDGLVISTPDDEFVFSLVPFHFKDASEDDITEAFMELAKAAKLDLEHAEEHDIKSETLDGTYKMSELGDGATCVGVTGSAETGKGFLITITASEKYMGYILVSLEHLNLLR